MSQQPASCDTSKFFDPPHSASKNLNTVNGGERREQLSIPCASEVRSSSQQSLQIVPHSPVVKKKTIQTKILSDEKQLLSQWITRKKRKQLNGPNAVSKVQSKRLFNFTEKQNNFHDADVLYNCGLTAENLDRLPRLPSQFIARDENDKTKSYSEIPVDEDFQSYATFSLTQSSTVATTQEAEPAWEAQSHQETRYALDGGKNLSQSIYNEAKFTEQRRNVVIPTAETESFNMPSCLDAPCNAIHGIPLLGSHAMRKTLLQCVGPVQLACSPVSGQNGAAHNSTSETQELGFTLSVATQTSVTFWRKKARNSQATLKVLKPANSCRKEYNPQSNLLDYAAITIADQRQHATRSPPFGYAPQNTVALKPSQDSFFPLGHKLPILMQVEL